MGAGRSSDLLCPAVPRNGNLNTPQVFRRCGRTRCRSRFSRTSFARLIENEPHLLRRINELVIRGLSRRSAEEEVASFLIGWPDRLARLGNATSTVSLPMGRQDIANFLGLAIETISRSFTKLERDEFIDIVPGGVGLEDLERVESLAAA